MNGADLERVRDWLRTARHIAVSSGAGMSAESGIATFRDALTKPPSRPWRRLPEGARFALGRPGGEAGLWSRFDPAQLASVEGFRADPERVWAWYAERRAAVRQAQPNAGHIALARFGARHPGRVTIVTQNVDDLHQRAGSERVIRLHGDILRDGWLDACPRRVACDTADAAGSPPSCAACGNRVRPQVVWFGEMLPADALVEAESAAERCDAMIVVGTSGAVYPAVGLARQARRAGAHVAIVNPQSSEIDEEAHVLLRGTAAGVLPALLDAL